MFASSGGGYDSLEGLVIEGLNIPIDFEGKTLIPFRGGPGNFDYVSATDILNKNADVSLLKNKLVIVGTTAPGLFDMRATPVSETYPGVEIHASLISGLLNQRGLKQPEYVLGYEMIVLVIAGFVMTIAGALLSPFHASLFWYFVDRKYYRAIPSRVVKWHGIACGFWDTYGSSDFYAQYVLWIFC